MKKTELTTIFAGLIVVLFSAGSFSKESPLALIITGKTVTYSSGLPGDFAGTLKKFSGKNKNALLHNALDSLGYFSQQWDSLAPDSFRIVPGFRAEIGKVSIDADTFFLRNILSVFATPCVYDASTVTRWIHEVVRIYSEYGYPFCKVTTDIELLHAKNPGKINGIDTFTVHFNIERDMFMRFGTPFVKGTSALSARMLFRDIRFKDGDTFDIRKVETTNYLLSSRPYIASVEIGTPFLKNTLDSILPGPGATPLPHVVSRNNDSGRAIVPLTITEKKGLGIDGALGFDANNGGTPQLRGKGTVNLLNLLHYGEQASLEYTGEQGYQKMQCDVSVPWLLNTPITGAVDGGLEIKEQEYGYLFGQAQFMVDLNDNWQAGGGINGHESTDSTSHYTFYGVQGVLSRLSEPLSMGSHSQELYIAVGSGLAHREILYSRTNLDFITGAQFPLFERFAFRCRVAAMNCITNESTMIPAEMYRVGGSSTVRGYADDLYAFRSTFWAQTEYLYYFTTSGSVFIFLDGGTGFPYQLSLTSQRQDLLGYGIGIRLPVRVGTLALAWARNREDQQSYGRIQIEFENSFNSKIKK